MGISIWQLLIVLVIVLLLFGTRKLRNLGSDLGGAIRGFKEAMSGNESPEAEKKTSESLQDSSEGERQGGEGVKTEKSDTPEREDL